MRILKKMMKIEEQEMIHSGIYTKIVTNSLLDLAQVLRKITLKIFIKLIQMMRNHLDVFRR
jgi:hypothetical protein